jgi:tetratricopeptide (TPR) repeat protein|tara:strand:- start:128 stop:820 length:693 start_codon:yes stop_codon:yes gene_type:complete
MDLKNQIELELYFADHFDTILFPVLADIYFNQEDYRRARKVCNIGLGYHENDAAGRFVLAKVEKAEGNLKDAEKELKHVLKYSPDNIDAAIMYCEIQTVLGRSPSRLLTSWKKVLALDPSNQIAREFIAKVESPKVENKKNKTTSKKASKRSTPKKVTKKVDENTDSLNVSVRLATFTLVNVLKNQALFYQALEVLDLLEQKGEDPDMIRLERDSVKALIKTSEKENEKS